MRLTLALLGTAGLAACGGDNTVDGFTLPEWAVIKKFGPLGAPPPNTTNKYADDANAAKFGQRLFFEKSYAGALTIGSDGMNGSPGNVGDTGKIGCVSCHDPNGWYIDTRSMPNNVSIGAKYTKRNAPSLVNAVYYKWYSWDGKEDSPWYQGANGPESAVNFGSGRLQWAHMVYAKYKDDYNALFPTPLDPGLDASLNPAGCTPPACRFPPAGKPNPSMPGVWEMMAPADQQIVNTIMANCGKSLEAYERLLVSKNAPIDKYIQARLDGEAGKTSDFSVMSQSAKNGLKLFIGKAGCAACHQGQTFTDLDDFYNTGVPQNAGPNVPMSDNGRNDAIPLTLANTFNTQGAFSDDPAAGMMKLAGLAQDPKFIGAFRIKSLRHVGKTAPYFHNGSMATLEDVVAFYNQGGGAMGFAGTKDPRIVPLNLTAQEQSDLVAFLRDGLQGEPPDPALGVDTSAP